MYELTSKRAGTFNYNASSVKEVADRHFGCFTGWTLSEYDNGDGMVFSTITNSVVAYIRKVVAA